MRPEWKFIEYWSTVLRKNRHFYCCSNCSFTTTYPEECCPKCEKEMYRKIKLK